MGKNASKALGAQGKVDCHMFPPEQLVIVEDDPKHPLYDGLEHKPKEHLVLDIMARGIHTPVKARRAGEAGGKPILEVVFGRDRVVAAIEANKRLVEKGALPVKVPTLIVRGDSKQLFGLVLSENAHRKTLSPLDNAKQMQRYLDYGASDDEVRVAMNISTATLRNYKALLECSDEVQKAVDKGLLSAEAAITLSALPHADQKKALEEMIASGATKGQRAVEAAKNAQVGKRASSQTTSKMRSRKFCEKAVDALEAARSHDATVAKNVVSFLLGQDAALDRLPSVVKQALAALVTKRAKK